MKATLRLLHLISIAKLLQQTGSETVKLSSNYITIKISQLFSVTLLSGAFLTRVGVAEKYTHCGSVRNARVYS